MAKAPKKEDKKKAAKKEDKKMDKKEEEKKGKKPFPFQPFGKKKK